MLHLMQNSSLLQVLSYFNKVLESNKEIEHQNFAFNNSNKCWDQLTFIEIGQRIYHKCGVITDYQHIFNDNVHGGDFRLITRYIFLKYTITLEQLN